MSYKKCITTTGVVSAVTLLMSCGQYPKDPENSLVEIHNKRLIVIGLVENPPYVSWVNGKPGGIEPRIIQAFAGSEGLSVKWMKGSTDHILALLEKGELHIAAGGFDQSCPWKEHVYFIRPHDTITYRWGATEQAELPEDLKGKEVVVRSGSAAAAYIPGSAQVEYRDSITGTEPLVVATEDELEAYGYRLSGKSLKKIHISLAIKNGENALLEEFEKFLSSYERESDR